jgi:hypothetical protein
MAISKQRQRQIAISFPLGGLNRKAAFRQQAPYTTFDALNVRPKSVLDGRLRGGSRPGLMQAYISDITAPIRLLAPMALALNDNFTAYSDVFDGTAMSSAWSTVLWTDDGVPIAKPKILPSALASVDTTQSLGEATLDLLPINTSDAYSVEMEITPGGAGFSGKYRIYLFLDNDEPNIEADGVMVELVMEADSMDFTGTFTVVSGGTATPTTMIPSTGSTTSGPAWLSVLVDGNGTTVTVYWNGLPIYTQEVTTRVGWRDALGMECTVAGGMCLANVFRVQYYSTGTVSALRSMLVVSADGSVYKEGPYGWLTVVEENLTLNSDIPLNAVQSGQELFIADYGTPVAIGTGGDGTVSTNSLTSATISDWNAIFTGTTIPNDMVVVISNGQPSSAVNNGTYTIESINDGSHLTLSGDMGSGTCDFRIERAPKVYDPSADTLSILTATVGQVPTGCPLITYFCDRIVLAGAQIAPHVWYMARRNNETDWDYAPVDMDVERAVAGTSSTAGVPGDPITALARHSDDYLIVGCQNSLWRMAGDPANGGTLSALSHIVGIIGAKAWCLGPDGSLIFLSLDGLYSLAAGGDTYPTPVSRDTLPAEFMNINPDMVTASLEYDIQGRGIHIYLTSVDSNARLHWWLDWTTKTFWPVSLNANYEPTYTCTVQARAIEDSGVILGGRDGTLRRLSDLASTDCGTVFESYVYLGPIALSSTSTAQPLVYQIGTMLSLDGVLAENSGNVTWAIQSALTFEGTASADESDTGSWIAGLNASVHPACRGQAFVLKLTGASGKQWAVEEITSVIKEAGRRRVP